MTLPKPPATGIARIYRAFFYSLDGFISCYRNEAAFRQELLLFIVLLPIISLLPIPLLWKGLLLTVNMLVLVVELLNSAIEAIVDKASPDYSELAKRAKDMGSAAVLVTLTLAAAIWAMAIWKACA